MIDRGALGRILALLALICLGLVQPAEAQTRFMYLSGQLVTPAFEGWWPNEDGTYKLFFGYMNSNWEQEFVIPVGRENYFAFVEPGELDDTERDAFDPAEADQGQPTHFYPRRNPFLFTVDVPADFGDELVWTLRTHGHVRRAYASLAPDYRIDPQVISTEVGGDYGSLRDALRYNIPPTIDIEGGVAHRTVRVGEPLRLAVHAEDPDNLPARRTRGGLPTTLDQLYRPPSSIVAISGPGLRFSWSVYRGDAEEVAFDPVQMKTWTDTRVYGNSAWSPPWYIPEPPPGNNWITEVTFDEPGEYTLRAVASDGSMFSYENVVVTVTPLLN